MKNLVRATLCFAILAGTATPSHAVICCLINKIVECPPVRQARMEHKAAKTAKKMQAKKPHFSCLKNMLNGCDGGCEGECSCNN
jgi:hypothetical protein